MDDDLRLRIVDLICEYPLHIGRQNTVEEKCCIRTEFDNFQLWARSLKSKSPASFEQFESRRRSMLNYFLTEGGYKWPLLKNLAVRIFSLIAKSACVERSNSMMGFIHSKLRSNLGHLKVVKLSYIKSNAAQVLKAVDLKILREIAEEENSYLDENEALFASDDDFIE